MIEHLEYRDLQPFDSQQASIISNVVLPLSYSYSTPTSEILLARSLSALLPSPITRRSIRIISTLATSQSPNDNLKHSNLSFNSSVESSEQPSNNSSISSPTVVRDSSRSSLFNSSLSGVSSFHPNRGISIDLDSVGVSIASSLNNVVTSNKQKSNRIYELAPWNLLSLFGFAKPQSSTEKRDILKGVVATILPGRLLGIIGPSGAGKTTLLNVIGGRINHTSGEIRFNGSIRTPNQMKSVCAYVQQQDLFLKDLTVEEHLQSQISLRLGHLSNTEQQHLLNDTILRFRLSPCRYTIIGPTMRNQGISGGERKRLNLASECVTNPSILLADEPTTGIDSFMAASVISTLRRFAASGRSVVATLHQPSSRLFNKFHEVMLLAEGRILYFGDRLGSIDWFERFGYSCPKLTNPADFLIRIVSLPENPELREKKLREINELADQWAREGDAFLEQWTDGERFRFFESSKTFAERSIEASLSQVTANTQEQKNEVISNTPIVTEGELRRLSNDVLKETFYYHSPRIARRELWNKINIRRQRFKQKESSPTSRNIDKKELQQRMLQKKISIIKRSKSCSPQLYRCRPSTPKSPPTFGAGSKIEPTKLTVKEESSPMYQSIDIERNESLIFNRSQEKKYFSFVFRILLNRSLISNRRDQIVFHARAFQTIIIALVYSSIFWRLGNSIEDAKSKLSAIFFVLTNQGLVGAVGVCSTFVNEKIIIYREVESRLFGITPYILAKIVADIPVQTIFPIIFNTICFWCMGFGTQWKRYLLSCLVALLVSNAAISVGYLGSATAPTSEQALITAQIWVLPALLFGGYAVKLDDIRFPLNLLQYLSYFRYGFIAYSHLIFSGESINIHRPIFYSGEKFVNDYVGFKLNNSFDFWTQIFLLFVMIILFRIIIILLVIPASKRWQENK